jgi:hypothetical protein
MSGRSIGVDAAHGLIAAERLTDQAPACLRAR